MTLEEIQKWEKYQAEQRANKEASKRNRAKVLAILNAKKSTALILIDEEILPTFNFAWIRSRAIPCYWLN